MATPFLMLPISYQFGCGDGPSHLHFTPTGSLSHHHLSKHGQKKTQAPRRAVSCPSDAFSLSWVALNTSYTRQSIADLFTSSFFKSQNLILAFHSLKCALYSLFPMLLHPLQLVPKFIPACFHGSFQRHKPKWAETHLSASDWKLAPNIAMSFRKTLHSHEIFFVAIVTLNMCPQALRFLFHLLVGKTSAISRNAIHQ